jgi:DNA-binding CsgD family transcriptional regulator
LGFKSLARSESLRARSLGDSAVPSGPFANMCSMDRKDRERRNDRFRERVAAGAPCKAIARELEVSLSVVSSVALRAGHRSRPGPPKKYDWAAIRDYYEQGRTKRECRERFDFSNGGWDQAVVRSDIVLRSRLDPVKHSHATREAVARLLTDGMSQADIARTLAISKSTVAFHVRNLGVPPDRRFSRRYNWAEIQLAYDGG